MSRSSAADSYLYKKYDEITELISKDPKDLRISQKIDYLVNDFENWIEGKREISDKFKKSILSHISNISEIDFIKNVVMKNHSTFSKDIFQEIVRTYRQLSENIGNFLLIDDTLNYIDGVSFSFSKKSKSRFVFSFHYNILTGGPIYTEEFSKKKGNEADFIRPFDIIRSDGLVTTTTSSGVTLTYNFASDKDCKELSYNTDGTIYGIFHKDRRENQIIKPANSANIRLFFDQIYNLKYVENAYYFSGNIIRDFFFKGFSKASYMDNYLPLRKYNFKTEEELKEMAKYIDIVLYDTSISDGKGGKRKVKVYGTTEKGNNDIKYITIEGFLAKDGKTPLKFDKPTIERLWTRATLADHHFYYFKVDPSIDLKNRVLETILIEAYKIFIPECKTQLDAVNEMIKVYGTDDGFESLLKQV